MPELLTRRGVFAPASANEAERTVEVVWSTGAPVVRHDAAGPYEERLSLAPEAVDLERFIGGPVLDSHRHDALDAVLGVVLDARVDGRQGTATVRFSERADAAWRDVLAGILRGVSVGYTVERWEDETREGRRVRTAVRWTPKELSLVAIPADAGAMIRKEIAMPSDDRPRADARASTTADIRRLVEAAGLERAVADELIDRGLDVPAAKDVILERLCQRSVPIASQRVEVLETHDAPEACIARMAAALEARLTGAAPSEAARPYMGLRLVDLAAELLSRRGIAGVRTMSADSILTRAHVTGDFPTLLTTTGNRVLLAAFEAAPNPLKRLARRTTVSDFRSKTVVKLSEFPALEAVAEHGEIRQGTRLEAKEAYQLKTYGKIFSISRQALINDDLNAFGDFSRAAGRAAAETEAAVLVGLLTANTGSGVTLDDGNPLFHSSHGNVASSGAAINTTSLAAARLALRQQKGLDGVTPINAVPRFLLVSPVKETEAEGVLAPIVPAQVSNVNPFAQRLDLLVEPRLTGNRWYVFAAPEDLPVLEYAYLSSAPGPQMASREGWDVLGLEFRVTLDFGAGVLDHRGAYMNPGA